MLFKSIFYSAEYSNLLKDNPTKNLNSKGGVPKKEIEALTDAQVEQQQTLPAAGGSVVC